MRDEIRKVFDRLNLDRKNKKTWMKIISVLAVCTLLITSYQLSWTGFTTDGNGLSGLQTYCGMEEHTHTDDCYQEQQTLICGMEEGEGHEHSDECYEEEEVLVCDNDDPEHEHDSSCYETERSLVCDLEECEGHTHSDDCYETEKVLVCDMEEHVHTAACYAAPEEEVSDDTADSDSDEDKTSDSTSEKSESASTSADSSQAAGEADSDDSSEDTSDVTYVVDQNMSKDAGIYVDTESAIETKDDEENTDTIKVCPYGEDSDQIGDRVLICDIDEPDHEHDEDCYHVHTKECFENIEYNTITAKATDGAIITITGNIPENASCTAVPVNDISSENLSEELGYESSNCVSVVASYDITIYIDGVEWEPDDSVQVSIILPEPVEPEEHSMVQVAHFAEDGTESIPASVEDEGNEVLFSTEGFSVYTIYITYNQYTYIPSGSSFWLSDVLPEVGIEYSSPYSIITLPTGITGNYYTAAKGVEITTNPWYMKDYLFNIDKSTFTSGTITVGEILTGQNYSINISAVTDYYEGEYESIDISKGRVVICDDYAEQYCFGSSSDYTASAALIARYHNSKNEYTFTGTQTFASYNFAQYNDLCATAPCSPYWGGNTGYYYCKPHIQTDTVKHQLFSVIEVTPTLEATIILDGIDITINNCAVYGINTTQSNTTIVLKDNSTNKISYTNNHAGGCLVKNGNDTYSLDIECEHSSESGHQCSKDTCGTLYCDAYGAHTACIGNSYPVNLSTYSSFKIGEPHLGGFNNLYIKGGNIYAQQNVYIAGSVYASHNPAIGISCGSNYADYTTGNVVYEITESEAYKNLQLGENIVISKARVYAYGGNSCPGIGGGCTQAFNGITIEDGAYVYAKGGNNSPGIGTGGEYSTSPQIRILDDYSYSFKNLSITGGKTVVEAEGGTSNSLTYAPYNYNTPGIGTGNSDMNDTFGDYRGFDANGKHGRGSIGTYTGYATPDAGYNVVIRQGTSKEEAVYVPGVPTKSSIFIEPDQFYTYVYFTNITKTASVNGAADNPGTVTSPVAVSAGDTIKYTINVADITKSESVAKGTITDEIPDGLTLVSDAGSYTSAMEWSTDGSIWYDAGTTSPEIGVKAKYVRWPNQNLATVTSCSFQVKVDALDAKATSSKTYNNQAELIGTSNGSEISLISNFTYHIQEKKLEQTLTITKVIKGLDTTEAAIVKDNLKICCQPSDTPGAVNLTSGAFKWTENGQTLTGTYNLNYYVPSSGEVSFKVMENVPSVEMNEYTLTTSQVCSPAGTEVKEYSEEQVEEEDEDTEEITIVTSSALTTYGAIVSMSAVTSASVKIINTYKKQNNDPMELTKTVSESETGNSQFTLTLESYSKGLTEIIDSTKPADVVIAVDQSCSMLSPIQYNGAFPSALELLYKQSDYSSAHITIAGDNITSREDFFGKIDKEKATHRGYYVVQSTYPHITDCESKTEKRYYWFALEYDSDNDKWNLYATNNCDKETAGKGYGSFRYPLNSSEIFKTESTDVLLGRSNELYVYKSRYAVIYDSLLESADTLAAQNRGHRLAFVGFSGNGVAYNESTSKYVYNENNNHTGIYSGGKFNISPYKTNGNLDGTPPGANTALNSVETESAIVKSNIDAIRTEYSYTLVPAGFQLAGKILNNSEAGRNKIVILFTDGICNKSTYGTSGEVGMAQAIKLAKNLLKDKNTSVYTIRTSNMTGSSYDYLTYSSSDYPDATASYNSTKVKSITPGTRASYIFSMKAQNAENIKEIFKKIMSYASRTVVKLTGSAITRDYITTDFTLPDNTTTSDIKVYTQAYLGSGKWSVETSEYTDAKINIVNSNLVKVSGFDYSAQYVHEAAEDGSFGAGGNKLIIKIPINVSSGAIAKTETYTNTTNSGIYENDTKEPGDVFYRYPVPSVELPAEVTVQKIVSGATSTGKFNMTWAGIVNTGYTELWPNVTYYDSMDFCYEGVERSNYLKAVTSPSSGGFSLMNNGTITLDAINVGSSLTVMETDFDGFCPVINVTDRDGNAYPEGSYSVICPGKVTILASSDTYPGVQDGMVITFTNMTGLELPSTGGSGTVLLMIAGALLVLMGGIGLVIRRRMQS